ncbi:MAG: TonB-dependent receptor, partial [Arenicella sp.]|nr:TonB-dependent receptor [Arenicella sp.]
NLDPREIEGVDFGIQYSVDIDAGSFDLKLNTAYLSRFNQDPSAPLQQLIDAGVSVTNAGSLIEQNGRPRVRSTASLNWKKDSWGAGMFVRYVGDIVDTSTRADRDTDNPGAALPVGDFTTVSANVRYRFDSGTLENSTIKLGMRNIFDEEPPVADQQLGYFGSLHSNRGRYAYAEFNKKF